LSIRRFDLSARGVHYRYHTTAIGFSRSCLDEPSTMLQYWLKALKMLLL